MFAKVFAGLFKNKTGADIPIEPGSIFNAIKNAQQDHLFRTINDYKECPWPANAARRERCEQCSANGGQFLIWYHGQRTLFDTRICVEHHGQREKRAHIARLIEDSGLDSTERGLTFARATIDVHNRRPMEALQAWQAGDIGVYLGPKPCQQNPHSTGTGKTHLLCAMALRLCQMGISVKFLRAAVFERDIRQAQADRANLGTVLAPYEFAEVLLWDDLGAEAMSASSDFIVARVYEILDYRCPRGEDRGFPTFISSNLALADLEARFGPNYGPKIASRVGGLVSSVHGIGGPDRRLERKR